MKSTNRYVALDVETTGFSPQNGDRVIEIGQMQMHRALYDAKLAAMIWLEMEKI